MRRVPAARRRSAALGRARAVSTCRLWHRGGYRFDVPVAVLNRGWVHIISRLRGLARLRSSLHIGIYASSCILPMVLMVSPMRLS